MRSRWWRQRWRSWCAKASSTRRRHRRRWQILAWMPSGAIRRTSKDRVQATGVFWVFWLTASPCGHWDICRMKARAANLFHELGGSERSLTLANPRSCADDPAASNMMKTRRGCAMPRRIACSLLSVLFAAGIAPKLFAQDQDDPLTEDEVQQIRDNKTNT